MSEEKLPKYAGRFCFLGPDGDCPFFSKTEKSTKCTLTDTELTRYVRKPDKELYYHICSDQTQEQILVDNRPKE